MGRPNQADGTAENSDCHAEPLTPSDVRAMRPTPDETVTEGEQAPSVFEAVLTPRSRAAIVDALVDARGKPLTVTEMIRENPKVSTSSFDRHKGDLLAYGIMEEAGMKGNATAYALNSDHPGAQVLVMFNNIMMWGETLQLLDDQFISDADHPLADA